MSTLCSYILFADRALGVSKYCYHQLCMWICWKGDKLCISTACCAVHFQVPDHESRSYSPDNTVPEVILFVVKMFQVMGADVLTRMLMLFCQLRGYPSFTALVEPKALAHCLMCLPLADSFCAVSGIVTFLFLRNMALASSSYSWLVDVGTHSKCSACHVQHLLNISSHSYKHFSKEECSLLWY
jgi:hypothetical protein